ncbi:MAG TPA: hypothetical protein VGM91_12150 [Conexibacter sp.]
MRFASSHRDGTRALHVDCFGDIALFRLRIGRRFEFDINVAAAEGARRRPRPGPRVDRVRLVFESNRPIAQVARYLGVPSARRPEDVQLVSRQRSSRCCAEVASAAG